MNILLCFGTRPEYIKLKSIIDNIKSNKNINYKLLFTGQHINLLENVHTDYKIIIDNISDNRLNDIWISIMKYSYIFDNITHVLVQGDTTSAVAMAMTGFHHMKTIIHLEAGLRTNTIDNPYPEELNRQIISRIATIHFCPTELNKQNLLTENIKGDIYVVGNTGLDNITKDNISYDNTILITLHRRDNQNIIDKWFNHINNIAKLHPELTFIFPAHPSPYIQNNLKLLTSKNINISKPLDHHDIIKIVKKCKFIVSDSGGLQEEASFLNKKIIICRKSTERPEILGKHGILCKDPINLQQYFDIVNVNYEINEVCPYKTDDIPVYIKIMNILNIYI